VPDHPYRLSYNTLTWSDNDPDLERVFAIKAAGWDGSALNNDANWSGPPSRRGHARAGRVRPSRAARRRPDRRRAVTRVTETKRM
jgi:hypothetical protein